LSRLALLILFLVKNNAEKAVVITTKKGLKFLVSIETWFYKMQSYTINTVLNARWFIHILDYNQRLFAASKLIFSHYRLMEAASI
jgi:hypothetical protein